MEEIELLTCFVQPLFFMRLRPGGQESQVLFITDEQKHDPNLGLGTTPMGAERFLQMLPQTGG